jgi:O-glycosyl hydrolase
MLRKQSWPGYYRLFEQQSSYHFVYSSSYVPVNKDVSITVTNTCVTDVLAAILNRTNLKYSGFGWWLDCN